LKQAFLAEGIDHHRFEPVSRTIESVYRLGRLDELKKFDRFLEKEKSCDR
jgi:hypothetical protein